MPTELDVFLQPRSVAVIGATERPFSWGSRIMEGLLAFPYQGKIYPVNHQSSTVHGIQAYPDVKSIPDSVELAVLTIPEASAERLVQDCCEKRVKGITIVTAGFGEAIEGGRAREAAIAKLARAHGARVIGPNVSGTFNLHAGFNAFPRHHLLATPLAGISQGGYAFGDLLDSGCARRMGVGKFVHTGNECDLQVTDFLDYFGKDPQVRGIVMYVETLRDGRRFLEVARRVGRDKPIILHKGGRTSSGIRAARSHTGAMAGSKEVYRAALRQVNVILSPTMELLLPLGHALIERPPMRGKRVGHRHDGRLVGRRPLGSLGRRGTDRAGVEPVRSSKPEVFGNAPASIRVQSRGHRSSRADGTFTGKAHRDRAGDRCFGRSRCPHSPRARPGRFCS